MKRFIRILAPALAVAFSAEAALAACQVEYKAKRDNPFELFYNVAIVNAPCSQAESALRAQLAQRGLTLLKIMSKKEK
jgi:outer membrane lipopolysaccharide assembly protein LptE/RlpB